ncbi:MAG: YgjV family protein [Firmicutes bacterium]|nr:YgjV family protein [Bacillota bacterium]
MSDFIIQGIGFLGLVFFVVSYQIRSNRALFLCQLLGCIVFSIQLYLLGAYTGAIGLLINIMRNLLLLKINDWQWVKSKLTLSAILVLLLAMTVHTWAGWISLLPLASVGITTIGYWTNNAQKIRLSQLFGSPCTLIYDLLMRSWGGAMSEAIALVSIIFSIYRFGWTNMGEGQIK